METLNQILPFAVSVITLIVGWLGGRRKSIAEVEIIKSDHAEKLLKLNDQYLIAPLTRRIDHLSAVVKKLEQAITKSAECENEICPIKQELKNQSK